MLGKDRGFALPRGATLNAESTTNNVVIGSVVIRPIESGRYLTEAPRVDLDGRSVLGGSKVIDGENLNSRIYHSPLRSAMPAFTGQNDDNSCQI
jgi:hypothetical protein